jgi:succinyl-diaminopimelate desuccinylase
MLDRILEYLDGQRETVIDLQRSLVAIPALGPTNDGQGEEDKAEFCRAWLRDLGVTDIVDVNAPDDRVPAGFRPNVVARVPGRDSSRTLWVISHLDVVPAGDLDMWDTDPFELHVDGDVLQGRGVEDNHQGIVSSFLLAKALLEQDATPPVNLGLILVSDEETASKYGLDHVLRERADLFGGGDLFLVPDFGNADSTMIEVAEKSMLWVKFTVQGKQCHASTPDQGRNSLVAAAHLITRLYGLYEAYGARDELFAPPYSTFEPTKKEANVPNINTIPGTDVFYMDSRVLPEYDLDVVLETVAGYCAEVEEKFGVAVKREVVQREQAAPPTEPDSEVVRRLQAGVRAVYGADAQPVGIGGGTVAAFLRHQGHAAAVWATCIHNAHQPNERSHVSTQIGDAKVMAHMLLNGAA